MLPAAADAVRGRCRVQVLRTRAAADVAEASASSEEEGSKGKEHPHRQMGKEASVYRKRSQQKGSAHVHDAGESE